LLADRLGGGSNPEEYSGRKEEKDFLIKVRHGNMFIMLKDLI